MSIPNSDSRRPSGLRRTRLPIVSSLPKNYFWLPVLFLVLLFWLANPFPDTVRASGVWYVAADGHNTNSCSAAGSPCVTINGAMAKAGFLSGDTIKVAAGTYTGSGFFVVTFTTNATVSGGWDSNFT